jgi:hypothetical protein
MAISSQFEMVCAFSDAKAAGRNRSSFLNGIRIETAGLFTRNDLPDLRRKPFRFHCRVNADQRNFSFDQQLIVVSLQQSLLHGERCFPSGNKRCLDPNQIVKPCRIAEINLHSDDRKNAPFLVKLLDGESALPEKFGSAALKEAEIAGMIDDPASVGIFVINPELHYFPLCFQTVLHD